MFRGQISCWILCRDTQSDIWYRNTGTSDTAPPSCLESLPGPTKVEVCQSYSIKKKAHTAWLTYPIMANLEITGAQAQQQCPDITASASPAYTICHYHAL